MFMGKPVNHNTWLPVPYCVFIEGIIINKTSRGPLMADKAERTETLNGFIVIRYHYYRSNRELQQW